VEVEREDVEMKKEKKRTITRRSIISSIIITSVGDGQRRQGSSVEEECVAEQLASSLFNANRD